MKLDISALVHKVDTPLILKHTPDDDTIILTKNSVSLRWTLCEEKWSCSQNLDNDCWGLVELSGKDLIETLDITASVTPLRDTGKFNIQYQGNLLEIIHELLPSLDSVKLIREYCQNLQEPILKNISTTIKRFYVDHKETPCGVVIEKEDIDDNFNRINEVICSFVDMCLFSDYPCDDNFHYDENHPCLYIYISGNFIIMHGKTSSPMCISLLKDFCAELGNIITGIPNQDLNTGLDEGDFYVFTDPDDLSTSLDVHVIQKYALKFKEHYPNFHVEGNISVFTQVSYIHK